MHTIEKTGTKFVWNSRSLCFVFHGIPNQRYSTVCDIGVLACVREFIQHCIVLILQARFREDSPRTKISRSFPFGLQF